MADRDQRRRGGGGRTLVVVVLVAVVALAIAYLRDCIPGFGAGSGSAPAQTPVPSETKSPPQTAAGELELTVNADQCRRGSEPPEPCEDLCRSLSAEPKTRKIVVNATLGTHAAVETLRRCLDDHGLRDVVVRTD